jgi:hypothetical protein
VVFLVAAVAVPLLSGERAHDRGKGSPKEGSGVERRLLRSFSVLRTPTSSPPLETQRAMERTVEAGDFGLVTRFAHEVPTAIFENAWVVPGTGYICVMASEPLVAGCNTTAQAIRHGMSVVAITPSAQGGRRKTYTLFGIAPDGVGQVLVREQAGKQAVVEVHDNVYAFRASRMVYSKLDQ